MGWWNQIKMAVTSHLGMISGEERAIMALGQHLKDMGKACEDERIVMHAKKLGKRFFRLPHSTPQAGQIDWVKLTNELAARHPELVTRYPLLVARVQEQAQKDLIPPKWGHALLGLIDQLNNEQRIMMEAQPAPITPTACPSAPAGGWGQAALVQLHQKSMDIETQRAMWNVRNNTLRRWVGKWKAVNEKNKEYAFLALFTAPFVMIFSSSPAALMASIAVGAAALAALMTLNSLAYSLSITDDAKERVASKLLATLKHHPQSKDLVEFLDAHLDHPDIYGHWWRQLEIILDDTAKDPFMDADVIEIEEAIVPARTQLIHALNDRVDVGNDDVTPKEMQRRTKL